jgi:integrase/recombinase XerD
MHSSCIGIESSLIIPENSSNSRQDRNSISCLKPYVPGTEKFGLYVMMKAYIEENEVLIMEKQATCVRDRLLIRLLFHLGCRISEALAIKIEDINLSQGTITIQHLKTRLKLTCPQCSGNLGKTHSFCPKCGITVEKAVAQAKEHHRMRTLPIDSDTLEMLEDYIRRGGPVTRDGMKLIFGINRHRAWQIVRDCLTRISTP